MLNISFRAAVAAAIVTIAAPAANALTFNGLEVISYEFRLQELRDFTIAGTTQLFPTPVQEPVSGNLQFLADLTQPATGVTPISVDLDIDLADGGGTRTASFDTTNTTVEVTPQGPVTQILFTGFTNVVGTGSANSDSFLLGTVVDPVTFQILQDGNGSDILTFQVGARGDEIIYGPLTGDVDIGVNAVPVPAALPLLASGMGLLAFFRRRRAAA